MQLHGTTIALGTAGLLILGPSGSGKSSLALDLMAVGAKLVADDRTDLHRDGSAVIASCPPALSGRIEARGIGILAVEPSGPVALAQIVDLGGVDGGQGAGHGDRLPQFHRHDVLGVSIPLVTMTYRPHLYAALRQLLLGGRIA